MSAYLELRRDGTVGPETAELLYRTVVAVARRGRYPAPSGRWEWSQDDVVEAAHDFLAGPAGTRRITTLYLRATDDDSLARLLWAAVQNYLRDQARATDRGALHRRLRDVVARADNPLVELDTPAGRAWSTEGLQHEPVWAGVEQDLLRAAWAVEGMRAVRWRQAARRSPVAEADSLARVLEGIVAAAGGPVPADAVQRVVEQRFGLGEPAAVVDLDDEPAAPDDQAGADPAAQVLADTAAAEIFDQLSARERVVLANLDRNVRELGGLLGVSKSTAATVRQRVEAILTQALQDTPDPDSVWARLQEQATAFADRWTDTRGSPSTESDADD